VQEAVDSGITFFDNCWEYHRGKTEDWMGKGLKGRRDKVFLMTKVCTHGARRAMIATQMLEQSLHRLQTDHLDLVAGTWRRAGTTTPELVHPARRRGGTRCSRQKRKAKVRFLGFTGHKDPAVALEMIDTGFPFDAVQMPLNAFDRSFSKLCGASAAGTQPARYRSPGMKPLSGHGEPIVQGELSAEEALRYAMSLPVATTIHRHRLSWTCCRQNVKIARISSDDTTEMRALRERTRQSAGDGRYELIRYR